MHGKVTKKPGWFDLKKYDDFKGIPPDQWAYQLTNRRSIALSVFPDLENSMIPLIIYLIK